MSVETQETRQVVIDPEEGCYGKTRVSTVGGINIYHQRGEFEARIAGQYIRGDRLKDVERDVRKETQRLQRLKEPILVMSPGNFGEGLQIGAIYGFYIKNHGGRDATYFVLSPDGRDGEVAQESHYRYFYEIDHEVLQEIQRLIEEKKRVTREIEALQERLVKIDLQDLRQRVLARIEAEAKEAGQ